MSKLIKSESVIYLSFYGVFFTTVRIWTTLSCSNYDINRISLLFDHYDRLFIEKDTHIVEDGDLQNM